MKKKSFFRKLPVVSLALLLSASFAVPSVGYADVNPDIRSRIVMKAAQGRILSDETGPAYVSPEISTSSSRPINVIVQLSSEPAAVGKFAARMGMRSMSAASMETAVTREQSSFIDQAKQLGIPLEVNYRYNTVLNGLEVTVAADRIPELAGISGVKSVYENKTYYSIPIQEAPALTASQATYDNAPLDQMNVPEAWAKGLTGQGLKVGVIDTGVDYKHPDLIDAYKGGWDSFEQDDDPYEEPPISKEDDPFEKGFEGTSHGTHVSGTVAGRAANKSSDIYQKGVAYEADLYVYKVLGRNAETGRSSGSSAQVIDGIERAVKDGMDVINLSLGSDVEKDPNSPDSMAVNNAVLSGVVAVVANGNAADSGPYYYSMGSPAGAQLAISVGAATSPSYYFTASASVTEATYQEETETPVSVTSAAYSDMDLNVMGWRVAEENFASILGTEPIDLVYADLGQTEDFNNLDVKDKVVLISRGNLAFVDKLANAKLKGAKAVIFFNGNSKPGNANEADLSESIDGRDGFIHSNLGESFEFIPTFDMEGVLGRAIARQMLSHPKEPLAVTFGGDYPRIEMMGDTMASFSSRGPNADGLLGIKPDLAAPGVNIRSTWPAYGLRNPEASYDKAYSRSSGTSMAAPHVAGLALLLLQEHPDWSPFDVRAALANTSESLFDDDGQLYDVYSQGAGRADVANALETPALLQTVEQLTILDKNLNPQQVVNYGSSASFGIQPAGSENQITELQLKNTSGSKVQYQARIELHRDVTSDPLSPIPTPDVSGITAELAGVAADGTISAEGGKAQPFFLSVGRKDTAADGVYEGAVVLEASGLPSLHLPFSLHVGEAPPATGHGIQEVTFTPTVITPNGDGKQDSADLSFRLTEDVNYIQLLLTDLPGNVVGIVDEFVEEDDKGELKLLDRGYYEYKGIDGSYIKMDGDGNLDLDDKGNPIISKLKEGTYSIVVDALLIQDNRLLAEYMGFRSFRVDLTPATKPGDGGSGGNNGGGSGGGAGGGTTTPTTPTPANPGPAQPAPSGAPALQSVVKQGQVVQSVPTSAAVAGQVQTLTVTDEDLQAAVNAAGTSRSAIVLSVAKPEGQSTRIVLTPSQLEILLKAATGSSVIVSNTSSSMAVPAALLKSVTAGSSLELIISTAESQSGVFTKGAAGVSFIGSPVTFEINAVSSGMGKAIAVPASQRIISSFTVPGQLEANSAGVLYTNGGQVNPAPSIMTKQKDGTTVVTVSRPGVSTYAAASRPVDFTDISSSYAQSQIRALAGKLLMNGTSDKTYSPKKNVTRAEFASMLSRALGLVPSKAAPFTDVKAGSWYAGHVAAAYEAGLVGGHANGSFDPNASISRQDMSVMLAKAIDLLQIEPKAEGPDRVPYGDASSLARYAQQSIETVSGLGLMNGETSGGLSFFRPQAATTREAAAKVLYLLLQKGELING